MKGPVQKSNFTSVQPSVTFRYTSRSMRSIRYFGQASYSSIRLWQSSETAKFNFDSDVELLHVPTIMHNIDYILPQGFYIAIKLDATRFDF